MKKLSKTKSNKLSTGVVSKENIVVKEYLIGEDKIELQINCKPTIAEFSEIVSVVSNSVFADGDYDPTLFEFLFAYCIIDTLTNINIKDMSLDKSWDLYAYSGIWKDICDILKDDKHNNILDTIHSSITQNINYMIKSELADKEHKLQDTLDILTEYSKALPFTQDVLESIDPEQFNKVIETINSGEFGDKILDSYIAQENE